MPSTQIELDDSHESLDRVVDISHREKSFWMRHETTQVSIQILQGMLSADSAQRSLCDSFQHRSRFEEEGGQCNST